MEQADVDQLEILTEQLEAIGDLWEIVISDDLEESQRSRMEELLLSVFRQKVEELKELDIGMESF